MDERIFGVVLVVMGVCSPGVSQSVEWTVATDLSAYFMGEPVTFTVDACNLGSEMATVNMNVAPVVVDAAGEAVFAFVLVPGVVWEDIPPGECLSASDRIWHQEDIFDPTVTDQVPPGWYRGELDGFLSQPFEIQQPATVPISTSMSIVIVIFIGIAGIQILRVCRD